MESLLRASGSPRTGVYKPFDSVLIANRGEIALRVIRAARAAGLHTIAVYSDADLGAPHTRAADRAIRIGSATASDSYLSITAILDAAQSTGAQAIHPGYGFLSESATFARACAAAGLNFIGPPGDVIDLMGRKDRARRVALAAGVPVTPAVEGDEDEDLISRALREVGLPLLVKAAAGGGGKGMRIVRAAGDLPGALAAAKREAVASFGDDTILVERFVERGRHVEVQIIADVYGLVVHLFDRDCSTQRRHQKILEEAPAPTISDVVRSELASAAVSMARSVGYVNAGTMEFLVEDDEFYFLEMNTRLQVEHPVTELISACDLVDLQLRVAQGQPLPFTQEQLTPSGHAMEVRVYAEDPDLGFLPQAGRVSALRWPRHARVDAALELGQVISTWYDPMLGKIVAHGPTREAARRALVAALDETVILGLRTNVGFLRQLVASDDFRDCTIDTAWLDRNPGRFPPEISAAVLCAAAWATATQSESDAPEDPFGIRDGWRLSGIGASIRVELQSADDDYVLLVNLALGTVSTTEWQRRVRCIDLPSTGIVTGLTTLKLEIEDQMEDFAVQFHISSVVVSYRGGVHVFQKTDHSSVMSDEVSDGQVNSPMPGVVTAIAVEVGSAVNSSDVLGVLEAMKMEHTLRSPFAGIVAEVRVAVGDRVPFGGLLFVIREAEDK